MTCVEVRRSVVVVIHRDHNAEEANARLANLPDVIDVDLATLTAERSLAIITVTPELGISLTHRHTVFTATEGELAGGRPPPKGGRPCLGSPRGRAYAAGDSSPRARSFQMAGGRCSRRRRARTALAPAAPISPSIPAAPIPASSHWKLLDEEAAP